MSQQPLIAESRRQMVVHSYFELDDPTANGTQTPNWIDMISLSEFLYHGRGVCAYEIAAAACGLGRSTVETHVVARTCAV
jgi:hypothetical protein